jgi:3-methyladenine DNA glycosylase AlkD
MRVVLKELKKYANAKRKTSNEWFFKTGPGQYGAGDRFIGVSNPDVRKVANRFLHLDFPAIEVVLNSVFHEERLVGVLILVQQYEQAATDGERLRLARFYVKHLRRVNNWDLVDLSAYKILGRAILEGRVEESILDRLAVSDNLWERRVAIIATMAFIQTGTYAASERIAKKLLDDKEDLMHKAVGWMLREVWKRDPQRCERFLLIHYSKLPRTTLRYAIERMNEEKRKRFLMKKLVGTKQVRG